MDKPTQWLFNSLFLLQHQSFGHEHLDDTTYSHAAASSDLTCVTIGYVPRLGSKVELWPVLPKALLAHVRERAMLPTSEVWG